MKQSDAVIKIRPPFPVESTPSPDAGLPRFVPRMTPFALPGNNPGERIYGLDELQDRKHPDHIAAAQALFRALGAKIRVGQDTNALLRIYPLHEAFGKSRDEVEARLQSWLKTIGWQYRIFGPNETGQGWTDPDFGRASYYNRTVWIYQPADPNGSFRDYAYTLAWRVTHEIAHALINDDLTARYGILGRRMGRLGRDMVYRAKGRATTHVTPLTLPEALRAVEWEHRAFAKQREILEKAFGIRITDEAFAKENLVNMADATYRILTGHFSSPGDVGVVPSARNPEEVFCRCVDLLWWAARELGHATLTETGVGARYRHISIPLPLADNAGTPFAEAPVRWFESRLSALGSGFRKHERVSGVWENGAGPREEPVAVYEATIEAGRLGDVVRLAHEASAVFRQEAILVEVAAVEKFLLGGQDGHVMPDLSGAAGSDGHEDA